MRVSRAWQWIGRRSSIPIPTVEVGAEIVRAAEKSVERSFRIVVNILLSLLGAVAIYLGLTTNVVPIPYWLALVAGVFALTLSILQWVDSIWSNAVTRQYNATLNKWARKASQFVTRIRLGRLLSLYGREEVAKRVLPADLVSHFSVSKTIVRRRRYGRILRISMIAGAVIIGGYLMMPGQFDSYYQAGEQVPLGSHFTMSITGELRCSQQDEFGSYCEVPALLENVSRFRQNIGPGSFGVIGPEGHSSLVDDYGLTAIANGNYYDYQAARSTFRPIGGVQPGGTIEAIFRFDVPPEIVPDELILIEREERGRAHISLVAS